VGLDQVDGLNSPDTLKCIQTNIMQM